MFKKIVVIFFLMFCKKMLKSVIYSVSIDNNVLTETKLFNNHSNKFYFNQSLLFSPQNLI